MFNNNKLNEILSLGATWIEIDVMSLLRCDCNAVWDELCGRLDELSLLVGDVKLRVISLDEVEG